jgi:hypothetical protein
MMPADAKTELTINADANQISGERLLGGPRGLARLRLNAFENRLGSANPRQVAEPRNVRSFTDRGQTQLGSKWSFLLGHP